MVDSGAFEAFMLDLGQKSKQRAVLFQNQKSGTKIYSLINEGDSIPPKLVEKSKKFNPAKTVQFFSMILGGSFILEGFKYGCTIQNYLHGMALEIRGESDFHRRVSIETWKKEIMR
ncbi:MAG: hypothetical protein H8E34_12165 [Bacteroidetes bacterium]|nr:hypothetical protein [Bacteroidota bacterium]